MVRNIMNFFCEVWMYLHESRLLFCERKYSWVVANQIKISVFPFFISAVLGIIIAVKYDGNNLFIVDTLSEFFQFKTLQITIYIALSAVVALWIAAALKKNIVAAYLESILNALLYWCFGTTSVIVAIFLGGSLPFYFDWLDAGSIEKLNSFLIFAVLVPSAFYVISRWANKGVIRFSES